MQNNTLRLQWPFGPTIVLGFLLFVVLLGVGELIARVETFQSIFIAPEMGSRHRQFEIQLGRLDELVQKEGEVDCIFLGNSMVMRGFDPHAFSQAYNGKTGQTIRCFNFGVDGMPVVSAGLVAEVLIHDYQPRLLIYGTDARDYAISKDASDAAVLLEMSWIKYRQGQFSPEGWLFEHSYLYRYREALQKLIRFDHRYTLKREADNSASARYGFVPDPTVGEFVQNPPKPQTEVSQVNYYFNLLSSYKILPENLTGLQQIIAQNSAEVQVILIEMPVPSTYFYFFGQRELDYQEFINAVGSIAQAEEILFWQTTPLHLIPAEGWVDYSHLNTTGARTFSEWLGNQVGQAVNESKIRIPIQ